MLCGDPSKPETGAKFHPETTADRFFDPKGDSLPLTSPCREGGR
jgi:hypothetical protein